MPEGAAKKRPPVDGPKTPARDAQRDTGGRGKGYFYSQLTGGKGGGKGDGKGKGKGRRKSAPGISNSDLKKVALRAGIKRLSAEMYNDLRERLSDYVREIVRRAQMFAINAQRSTLTTSDIGNALRSMDTAVVGMAAR